MPDMVARLLLAGAGLACVAEGLGLEFHRADSKPVAILVSGMYDRLLVTPLMENLVRANVEAGTPVDIYFSMKPPMHEQNYAANKGESKWLLTENSASKYTVDPKIAKVKSVKSSQEDLLSELCSWARQAGAITCRSEPELDVPLELPNDTAHQTVMSYYNPLSTESGRNVLRRWRTIERLWDQAKGAESTNGFRYNSVLLVRDDDYWLHPYTFETSDFEARPNTVKSISCLEAHGINDKMLHLGRVAADSVIPAYQAWKELPSEALQSTRNAEEFLFKMAMLRGVGLRPRGLPLALATTTVSGIPCFRKQSYNLSDHGGYQKCHDESNEHSALTKLFRTFSCDTMSSTFYDALATSDVAALNSAVAEAAGDERKPIVFSFVNSDTVQRTKDMLTSLSMADSQRKALVVARQEGICSQLSSANVVCASLASGAGGSAAAVEHALLTTALLSGATEGILFAEPGVAFKGDPIEMFKGAGKNKDVIFAPESTQTCTEVADGSDANSRLFYLKDTPGAAHALMRAWMFIAEGALPGGVFAGETVVSKMTWEATSRRAGVKLGDEGTVRSLSRKDTERVVIDFPGSPGLALMPKFFSRKARFTSTLARAAETSTGVRIGAVACAQTTW